MNENKKTYMYIGIIFLLICAVSLYRKLSERYLPGDVLRPFIVYSVYIILMGLWIFSVNQRITQHSMSRNLKLAAIVMIFWLIIRLLQEAFFYKNIHIMRVSGYFTVFPLIVTTLFGIYAALGLGMGDDYTIPKKWYLLIIPDAFLVILELTNEYHHAVFKVLPGEEENIEFHTNYGFIIILLFAAFLILSRIYIIYRKTQMVKTGSLNKALPFIIGAAIPVVILPYLLNAFTPKGELIELTVVLYILEIMSWEVCIVLGLVPVNTHYGLVFERSTVGMRIINRQGDTRIKSSHAKELTQNEINALIKNGLLSTDEGIELRIHSITDGFLIYQNDVSQIRSIIAELDSISNELKQENTLLASELRSKSEKSRVEAQNAIYNGLSAEVGGQLSLIEKLIKRANDEKKENVLKELCIAGTYVKRRCNLRIIERESGSISGNELYLSLEDVVRGLNSVGIKAGLIWLPKREFSSDYSLKAFDKIESILEQNSFNLKEISIAVRENITLEFTTPNDEKEVMKVKESEA